MVTSLLSFSTFYFGFVLTNLATFSTQTILAVYIIYLRFMGRLLPKVQFGELLWDFLW